MKKISKTKVIFFHYVPNAARYQMTFGPELVPGPGVGNPHLKDSQTHFALLY